MAALERTPAGRTTDLAAPLEQIAQTVRKRGLVVLVSDLLAPSEILRTQLRYLRGRGHDVVLFRVLDPAEINFSFDQPRLFLDMESGRKLYIDPDAARAEYLERFRAHAEQLSSHCRQLGADLVECPTDRPLELSLVDMLRARMRLGVRPARREPGTGGRR
jgi:uncharacterized protein (DUF58 family)